MPQGALHADRGRAGGDRPRRLHRRDGLAGPRRRHGPQHPDPQRGSGGPHPALPHRRRHRDRFRPAAGTRRNPRQGARHAARARGRGMSARIFRGVERIASVDPGNRGLNYGDGLFETMRVDRGALPLWPRHLARLREGAARLGIAMPARDAVEARIYDVVAGVDGGVLKLLLTRGEGGRGYAPPPAAAPVWLLSLHPLPAALESDLRLHWCQTRLAPQPALAGIKHCNRLEQVVARAEAERARADVGLLRDIAGNAVGATSANLLALRDGRWLTPPVEACGAAGVLRGWLLERGLVEVS